MTLKKATHNRRGAVVVLAAILMIVLLGMVAFAMDLGYLVNARTELQRSADSAAIAATWELIDDQPGPNMDLSDEIAKARQFAAQYASLNFVCSSSPGVNQNASNSTSGDVVVGYLQNPSDPSQQMTFANQNQYNSVQVTVRRSAAENGEVPMFFGRVLGDQSQGVTAQATAAILNNFAGFRAPADGTNLGMLPFALDKQTWDGMMQGQGQGQDQWAVDPSTGNVSHGSDGAPEVNLYPQGTGSPGNRGTVDIGGSNNSTADIERQIRNGISADDLVKLGKPLALDANGELKLNGDTGISAAVKDDLSSIIGKPRVLPIFSAVAGNGNNSQYTIVQFVGVRITEVVLTGKMSSKRVMIQPAAVISEGGIPNTNGGQTSYGVYSKVWLVR
ncbi:MAG: hypothetical protein HYX69_10545 [Planctomycetia bacterium]|nr:hypothetical protein [Planctomycetia bacterium]